MAGIKYMIIWLRGEGHHCNWCIHENGGIKIVYPTSSRTNAGSVATISGFLTRCSMIGISFREKPGGPENPKARRHTAHRTFFLRNLVVWAATLCTKPTQDLYWDTVHTDGIKGHKFTKACYVYILLITISANVISLYSIFLIAIYAWALV